MEIRFEREPLYTEVWSTPMTTLAKKYGLSDNGLRKVCKALDIPLPPVGYWAKIEAGHSIPKPPLPKINGASVFISRPIRTDRPYADAEDDTWLSERCALEDAEQNRIAVAMPVRTWHPALAAFQKEFSDESKRCGKALSAYSAAGRGKFNPERHGFERLTWFWFLRAGQVLFSSHKQMAMRVSPGTCARALAIVNAVYREGERRGYIVEHDEDFERFGLKVRGELIRFRVVERQRQEVGEVDGRPEKVRLPTGKLVIYVGELYRGERQVAESNDEPLEERVNDIFRLMYREVVRQRELAREHQARERKWEEERRAGEEKQRHAEEARRRKEQERRRRTALVVEAKQWRQSQLIREYVNHVIASAGVPTPQQLHEWRDWALCVAEDLDLTTRRIPT